MQDWVRGVADQLAKEGFIAIAPDLLSGMGPNGGGTASLGDQVGQTIRTLTNADGRGATERGARVRPADSRGVRARGVGRLLLGRRGELQLRAERSRRSTRPCRTTGRCRPIPAEYVARGAADPGALRRGRRARGRQHSRGDGRDREEPCDATIRTCSRAPGTASCARRTVRTARTCAPRASRGRSCSSSSESTRALKNVALTPSSSSLPRWLRRGW